MTRLRNEVGWLLVIVDASCKEKGRVPSRKAAQGQRAIMMKRVRGRGYRRSTAKPTRCNPVARAMHKFHHERTVEDERFNRIKHKKDWLDEELDLDSELRT